MEIEKLREFSCLAKTLNYRVASNRCYISQPTLSKHISALEEELGCKLLTRTKSNVALTPKGKLLLDYADKIIASYSACLDELNDAKSTAKHTINIGYMYEPDHQILAGFYQFSQTSFAEKNISINFKLLQCETIKQHLDGGLIDLALDADVLYKDSHVYSTVPIYRDSFAVIVPPTHTFAKRKSITVEELKNQTLIIPFSASECFHSDFSRTVFNSILPKSTKFAPSYSDPTEIPWYVNSGSGIAFAGGCTFESSYDPHLVSVPITNPSIEYTESAVWKKSQQTPALLEFVDLLEQFIRSDNFDDSLPEFAKNKVKQPPRT